MIQLPGIAGIDEAFPDHRYPQETLARALAGLWKDAPADPALIERTFRHTTVESRHLALPLEEYSRPVPWGETNSRWIRHAQELGLRAARGALDRARVRPEEIDSIVFVTVTGLSTPSIDALIAGRLGLRRGVKRLPIFGLGCVAGASGLARCADLVRGSAGGAVLLLSVELCSLTFQHDDRTMANLIATGLFGDGAAAVVLTAGGGSPAIVDSASILYPGTERVMGWEISERGFRLVLSPEIPSLIGAHLRQDVDAFLAPHGLTRADIAEWIIHTGGPKVFAAIEESLELPASALARTRGVLRRAGNLSSASVLVVLKDAMDREPPARGSHGLMIAVGPGFCAELVLLKW